VTLMAVVLKGVGTPCANSNSSSTDMSLSRITRVRLLAAALCLCPATAWCYENELMHISCTASQRSQASRGCSPPPPSRPFGFTDYSCYLPTHRLCSLHGLNLL
jgi:hypothetical protein